MRQQQLFLQSRQKRDEHSDRNDHVAARSGVGAVQVLQRILNWFGVTLVPSAGAVLVLTGAVEAIPGLMLVATVPLITRLAAASPAAPEALRLLAVAANWTGMVLAGSLAAAAATGVGGAFPFFPILGCAAGLYAWNAATLAFAGG